MKKICFLLVCLSCLLYSNSIHASASTLPIPSQYDIHTQFVSESGTTLEQLSMGGVGQGVILYYRADHDADHPTLAVRLMKEAATSNARADVYSSTTADPTFTWTMKSGQVAFDGVTGLSITFVSFDGWWVRDGRPNYNLNIQVNGPVYAMWGGSYDFEKKVPTGWTALMQPRQPAVAVEVRDPQHSGEPLWDWRNALANIAYLQTNYAERKCDTPHTYDLGITPLWPYVSGMVKKIGLNDSVSYQTSGFEQTGTVHAPPIIIDWGIGKITHFSEFVSVRNQNCSYSHYSINALQTDRRNQLDFETPFAFYDLSGEGKGKPNLILRTEHYYAGDPESTGVSILSHNAVSLCRAIWSAFAIRGATHRATYRGITRLKCLALHPILLTHRLPAAKFG